MRRSLPIVAAIFSLILLAACGGGGSNSAPPPALFNVSASASAVTVSQAGASVSVNLTVTRTSTNALTITQTGLPAGVTFTVANSTDAPKVTLQVASVGTAPAGTYPTNITVSDGQHSGVVHVDVTIAIAASVQAAPSIVSGMFISTSFQPADWDYAYFQTNTTAKLQTLNNLGSQHINIQSMDGATDHLDPSQSGPLDFSKMDAVVQPLLTATDGSPLFQVYAPSWMWVGGNSANGLIDPTFNQFADFAAMLVKYYNVPGGVTINGVTYASPAAHPIQWWGIFNEPNYNSLTPRQYVQLYNLTAQKMLAVDPTIKLVGIELGDYTGVAQLWVPPFVAGVTQPVHAIATHYYSSCNQRDTDQQLMNNVTMFHDQVAYFRQQMSTNPMLATLPIWITENNVNADFANGTKSACNPSQTFVSDARGSSAFFAAWRPYVYSQVDLASASSLHHWSYNADQQFGEVDYNTGNTLLSYWVDYWLGRYMTDPAGVERLPISTTQSTTVEIAAVRRPDASVVVMISNHAVHSSTDNNGTGDPRTVLLDLSALGSFKSATTLTFNAQTSAATGPAETAITPSQTMTVSQNGYGVTFVRLVP